VLISQIVLEGSTLSFFSVYQKKEKKKKEVCEQQLCFILAPKAAEMTNATIFQYVASSRKYFKICCNCCM